MKYIKEFNENSKVSEIIEDACITLEDIGFKIRRNVDISYNSAILFLDRSFVCINKKESMMEIIKVSSELKKIGSRLRFFNSEGTIVIRLSILNSDSNNRSETISVVINLDKDENKIPIGILRTIILNAKKIESYIMIRVN